MRQLVCQQAKAVTAQATAFFPLGDVMNKFLNNFDVFCSNQLKVVSNFGMLGISID
jgi:hypothetical protein